MNNFVSAESQPCCSHDILHFSARVLVSEDGERHYLKYITVTGEVLDIVLERVTGAAGAVVVYLTTGRLLDLCKFACMALVAVLRA